ncbi:hypothetical protein R4P64_30470 [Rhodococcus sp. IEGM 1366]|uniref:hypothetical protein n=1 Tax=Rhodococcus sp. IEGM 1366 TaxID=3082223 RepID=UPI002952A02A|nr:hypothetical protein [Rhodococcus sp. IEGM 1366]MDV8070852.1 hypothetical protein [Rhodococcus sp. IEGM 1366]
MSIHIACVTHVSYSGQVAVDAQGHNGCDAHPFGTALVGWRISGRSDGLSECRRNGAEGGVIEPDSSATCAGSGSDSLLTRNAAYFSPRREVRTTNDWREWTQRMTTPKDMSPPARRRNPVLK